MGRQETVDDGPNGLEAITNATNELNRALFNPTWLPAARHPAKFSDAVLAVIADELPHYISPDVGARILDPFAGVGKIHALRDLGYNTIGIEIEPEWGWHYGTIVADFFAVAKLWQGSGKTFDGVVTSPTYGNRMADHHNATDLSRRNTYKHALGRNLSANNSGTLQWGRGYKQFHIRAWVYVWDLLRDGGVFVLNISDHIRKGQRVPVVDWHRNTLTDGVGFELLDEKPIKTRRLRQGANHDARVDYEWLMFFRKGE